MHAAPPHALADLTASVADEPRWGAALHRYAASFGDGLLGGAVMAGGVSQLARWESEFAARPDVDYWPRSRAAGRLRPGGDGHTCRGSAGLRPALPSARPAVGCNGPE